MSEIEQYLTVLGWQPKEAHGFTSPSGKERITFYRDGRFRSFEVRSWKAIVGSSIESTMVYGVEEIRSFIERYGEKAA